MRLTSRVAGLAAISLVLATWSPSATRSPQPSPADRCRHARLFASTTGSDADWIVKLIDVYPELHPDNWSLAGYQLMVSNEVFRGRYRQSFEKPAPIILGAIPEYAFSLHTQNTPGGFSTTEERRTQRRQKVSVNSVALW